MEVTMLCSSIIAREAVVNRVANDFYPTQKRLVDLLLAKVKIEGTVFEPCAGDGAIARHFPNCITNDLHPREEIATDFTLNAADPDSWLVFPQCDWVVTNPPFKLASEILPLAFDRASVGVAFLLRLTYLEPTKNRGDWLQEHSDSMTHLIPVSPRPRFRYDTKGSDSVTCAWFVWQKDWSWRDRGIQCPFTFSRF